MASYSVNKAAVAHARRLIESRQYVLDSDWGEVQPDAQAQNDYLAKHSWDEFAHWHLGLTDGATDETKARYAFVYGDLRRLHRTGLIACAYRASEWRHKDIELAGRRHSPCSGGRVDELTVTAADDLDRPIVWVAVSPAWVAARADSSVPPRFTRMGHRARGVRMAPWPVRRRPSRTPEV